MIDKIKGKELFDTIPRNKRLKDYTKKEKETWIEASRLYYARREGVAEELFDFGTKRENRIEQEDKAKKEQKQIEQERTLRTRRHPLNDEERNDELFFSRDSRYPSFEMPPVYRESDWHIDESGRWDMYDGWDNPGPTYSWTPKKKYWDYR